MMETRRSNARAAFFAVAAALFCWVADAPAQTYPSRQVKIIVPAAPGGITDVLARILAAALQKSMGKPFVVENRTGANGLIAVDAVAKSAPDGLTLLVSYGGPVGVGLGLYKSVPYDVMRDLAPVSMVAYVTMVLVSHPGFKPQSVNELIAYAKASPGKVNVAVNSYGSMGHMLAEQFRLVTKTKMTMVAYRGSGPAVADLLAGHVDVDFDALPTVIEQIKAGRLRPLAIASANRSELIPEVPTFREFGLAGMETRSWFALLAPAGTPKEIIGQLNEETTKILQAAEIKESLVKQGVSAWPSTSLETGAFIREEIDRWARIVKEAGMKAE